MYRSTQQDSASVERTTFVMVRTILYFSEFLIYNEHVLVFLKITSLLISKECIEFIFFYENGSCLWGKNKFAQALSTYYPVGSVFRCTDDLTP